MAARLTNFQKNKIIADYIELGSKRATARKNGVAENTVRKIIAEYPDLKEAYAAKEQANAKDIMSYMESKRDIVCEIIGKGLDVLNDDKKIKSSSLIQVTTALGILIDKFTMASAAPVDDAHEDELSRSLRKMGEDLTGDK